MPGFDGEGSGFDDPDFGFDDPGPGESGYVPRPPLDLGPVAAVPPLPSDLYLLDQARQPVRLLDHQGITWKTALWGGSSIVVSLDSAYYRAIEDLIPGGFFYLPKAQKAYRVEEIDLAEEGPVDKISMTALAPDALFTERVISPPPAETHDSITGPAETAMKHYVDGHAGPGADPARAFPDLVVALDLGRGDEVEVNARFQYLDAMLSEIGLNTQVGWETTYDPDADEWTFEVIVGTDRTVEGPGQVILDPDFDTADQVRWLRTQAGSKSIAIVAGQGEGTGREVQEIFDGDEPVGFARRELFVDARDVEDATALPARARASLLETRQDDPIQVNLTDRGLFRLGTDFFLGDVVMVRHRRWGLQTASRIISTEMAIGGSEGSEAGEILTTKVEIGSPWPTIRSAVLGDQELLEGSNRT